MAINFASNTKFELLSDDNLAEIHRASLQILQELGVRVDDKKIRNMLAEKGAALEGDLVFIPEKLVEQALADAPKTITIYNRSGREAMKLGTEAVYFGTHADMLQFLDPFTGEVREFKRQDTEMMVKIAESLDNIDFILAVGLAGDVPEKIQSQLALLDVVKNCSKPVNFSSNDVQGLKDQLKILEAVSGGSEKFKEKPFAFYYCEPIPPLYHPQESTDKLSIVAENEIPNVYMPYCMLGGTAPVTFAGALAQSNAEVLSGLVIHQLINAGAPIIYGAMPSIFDMKTTIGSYGAPEFHMLVAAAAELASFYKLPFYGTAGTTDARSIDEQAVSEAAMSCFSTILSKADLVHDVGIMDHCNSLSPEMVVLFAEIIDMLSVYRKGIAVNSEELALEVIAEVGPAGHYLTHDHTNENFRNIWYPELFSRDMEGKEISQIREKIKARITEITEREGERLSEENQVQALDEIEESLWKRV